MEDYKKKYEDALERAKKVNNGEFTIRPSEVNDFNVYEYIFPELKESEDDRIRKMLIRIYKKADMGGEIFGEGITYKQVIAWLEKQGEQKPTDKVKQNFKCGEWIVCFDEDEGETSIPEKVVDFSGNKVRLVDIYGVFMTCPKSVLEQYHLWTIQDAKDGDVLTTDTWTFIFKKYQDKSVYYHCAVSIYNNFSISDTGEFDSNYVHPATKEQRELLFQNMKGAGYKWMPRKRN